jgi:uncharacterized lipoprotein YddW (UPF0748 family)
VRRTTASRDTDATDRARAAGGLAAFVLASLVLLAAAFSPARAVSDEAWIPEGESAMPPESLAVLRSVAAGDTASGAVEFLWVLRNSLVDSTDVPRLVERAKAMHVRGLLVQVVGRGDAWYRSDLLPYPEPIREPGRDPLGELLPLAHAAGLEVHAWVNCCLVWSAPRLPRDPRHVVNAHPEWVARLRDGRAMTRLGERERERLRVEGVFLSPGHPGVREHLANVVREIVTRYPVDGIHLDYIRQPSVAIGYDPTTRAQFALLHGADPAAFGLLPWAERARMDSLWGAFQEEQVTAIVRAVRDTLNAVRPGITLSAAVLADTLGARRTNRQAWSAWLRDGLLDRAFAMCYAPPVQTVLGQLAAMSAQVGTARVVPGIAVYNTPPSTAAAKIKGARALGFPAIALYSYDSLWERSDGWSRLLEFVNGPRSLLEARP